MLAKYNPSFFVLNLVERKYLELRDSLETQYYITLFLNCQYFNVYNRFLWYMTD